MLLKRKAACPRMGRGNSKGGGGNAFVLILRNGLCISPIVKYIRCFNICNRLGILLLTLNIDAKGF